jgi:hypothetical protein
MLQNCEPTWGRRRYTKEKRKKETIQIKEEIKEEKGMKKKGTSKRKRRKGHRKRRKQQRDSMFTRFVRP